MVSYVVSFEVLPVNHKYVNSDIDVLISCLYK